MRAIEIAAAAGLLLLAASPLPAQVPLERPAAPVVTVGANLKELIFDWEPVEGAVIYRVMHKLTDHPREYFSPIGDRIPASQTRAGLPIAVHQQLWTTTRYLILACNLAGCTRSAEIFPRDLMLDTIGYFKASNTNASDRFGRQVAMSADGSRLAVSAEGESSIATGVNGNQASNAAPNSGAVYVFRRDGRRWTQEAYLKASTSEPQALFGAGSPLNFRTLSFNEDGSVLAVGAPARSVATVSAHEGTVYVFERATGNTWRQVTQLIAPGPVSQDYFGYSVDLSSDGLTIKVNSLRPTDTEGNSEVRTHLWVRQLGLWRFSVTLAPFYPGDKCPTVRMSADGTTLVSVCVTPEFAARAVTMKRQFNDTWLHAVDLPLVYFQGRSNLAITYNASLLAIYEGTNGVGMYEWRNSRWMLDTHILESNFTVGPSDNYAQSLEFDRLGNFLAIGDPGSPAAGAGVAPFVTDGTVREGGVYLWEHVPGSPPFWAFRKMVKAPNPQLNDHFGTTVALSGNGRILAVGAESEDGAARGVDGNQNSESALESGAVYLY